MLPQIVCNIGLGEKPVAVADANNIENITLTWKSKDEGAVFSDRSPPVRPASLYAMEADHLRLFDSRMGNIIVLLR